MRRMTRTFLTETFLLTWFIICLVLFVYISRVSYLHISILPDWQLVLKTLTGIMPLHYILDLLRAVLGVMLFSLACFTLGLSIFHIWIKSQASILVTGVTAFIIGEIVFSLVFLTLISIYRLTPALVITFLSIGFLVGFRVLKLFIDRLSHPILSTDLGRIDRIIWWMLASIFVLSLLYSSARLSYDAVAEYFSHAKIMAVSQLPIFFYPKDSFVVSSFHLGILFTALIQIFGDQSARMLSWVNGAMILLMGSALGQELGLKPRARLWFLTLMFTSTAFVDLLGDGKIELIATAPILVGIYWMLRGGEDMEQNTFLLIGFLMGFAFIARPYNIFLISVFMVLFYLCQFYVQKKEGHFEFKHFVRPVSWMLFPMLILGLFHLLENWFFLKSPVAPLTYARELTSNDWQWQFDPAYLPLYRLFYPFIVTFQNSPQSLGNISPIFISFLPSLFIKKIRQNLHISPRTKRLFLVVLLTLLLWIALFFTVVEIRYVLFLWVILFLAISQIIEIAIQHTETFIHSLTHPVLIILLAFMGIRILFIALNTYSPLDAKGQAHCYNINFCTFLEPVNQTASPGNRVLVLNAYRYYLRPDLFACSSRSEEYPPLEELARQNSPDFWVEVYRRGYLFLTFEDNFAKRHSHFGAIPDPKLAPSWLNVTTLSSSSTNAEVAYRIETINPPFQPEITCQQNTEGIWQLISTSEP